MILNSSSNGGHTQVFRRGQEVVAQRCSEIASRHLYGQALTIAAANRRVDVLKSLLESNVEYSLEELTKSLNSVCVWAGEEVLQSFLKHDAKKILGIQQYSSGISYAARNNNSRIVVYLLEKHPEHDNLAVDPATVFDVSANGFLDVLIPLIDHIQRKDSFERILSQCLQVASNHGHDEIVEYLIERGADVNTVIAFDEDLFNGQYQITRYGSTRKLNALQAALIGFNRFGSSGLQAAFNDFDWFLRHKAYVNEQRASASSRKRTIKLLLENGSDPNGTNGYERYPLNIAAAYCTGEIVQELISSGADAEKVTTEHGTALQAAARREKNGLSIIKALLGSKFLLPSFYSYKAAALNETLSFFSDSTGRFSYSSSVAEVMNTGPGAVVKFLLANLPDEKAIDSRYCLLAQMACMVGDIECVDLLLQRGMDVNFSGYHYGTALQAASRVGNVEIVERLLESGAEPDILHGVHGTALRAAVIQGHEDLVRLLITHGADVNLRYNDNSDSVLHLALGSKNDAIFKLLIDAGADMNIATSKLHVLILACRHGKAALVELLLASGVDVSVSRTKSESRAYIPYEEATPLHAACANSHLPVVQLLVDHGADIEKTNQSSATPLIAAIRANDLSIIRSLLDAGANVNHAVDVTPLSEAAEKCELEIIEELLSAGAIIGGPSTKENALARACRSRRHIVAELLLAKIWDNEYEVEIRSEALSVAIERGNHEMVRLLLEHGTSPSFETLRQACVVGVLEVVKVLIDTGIDVNEDDGNDSPLLHVAACHSRPDIVQFLIGRGANTMLRSATYGCPLIAALEGTMAHFLRSRWQPESCRSLAMKLPRHNIRGMTETPKTPGYKEVLQCEQTVRFLFDASAEMDTAVRDFGNALHLASYVGSEVIVRQLLERTEDINIIGGYFESPLIAGIAGDHPTIVDLLLNRGSDVNQFLPEHGSALHYACGHGSERLTQDLLNHGADINAYDDKHSSVLAAVLSRSSQGFSRPPLRGRGIRSTDEQRPIIELLLRHEPKVQIRECDLLAAASHIHDPDGQEVMRLLFRHDTTIVVTEAVIVKAIQTDPYDWRDISETLRLLLEHDGGLGTTPAMFEAAKMLPDRTKTRITKILIDHKPCNIEMIANIRESMGQFVVPELWDKGGNSWKTRSISFGFRKSVEFAARIRGKTA